MTKADVDRAADVDAGGIAIRASDFDRGEITVAWVHDRTSKRHALVYSVVELCPVEQPRSPLLGSSEHGQVRVAVDGAQTLYLRREHVTVAEAIDFYRGTASGRTLPGLVAHGIRIETAGTLVDMTTDEESVLISSNLADTTTVGAVLPRRATALSLLSKLDTTRATIALLETGNARRVKNEVLAALGVDLERFDEHVGALHLTFANPLIRRLDVGLSDDRRALLVQCYERAGRSVRGCAVHIANKWPSLGRGFHVRHVLQSPQAVVSLPAGPNQLDVRLFDSRGNCIEANTYAYPTGVELEVGLARRRRVNLIEDDGSEQSYEVETVSYEKTPRRAAKDLHPLQHLAAASRRRELEDLARQRVFMFFPGGTESKREARALIRELIGAAKTRCWVLDPYLSGDDALRFLPFVRVRRCDVRLLSSQKFLADPSPSGVRAEIAFARRIDELRTKLQLKIEGRKLPGREKSPVHDRVLIVDDTVFMIGSSLDELGSRATTVFRVPHPARLIAEFENWWPRALTLDTTVRQRTLRDELHTLGEQCRRVLRTSSAIAARAIGRTPSDGGNSDET